VKNPDLIGGAKEFGVAAPESTESRIDTLRALEYCVEKSFGMIPRNTKIVATVSDRNCDASLISELRDAGMSVVRLNTAHQEPEDTLKVIRNVRAVSDTISLMLDTKGPEVRTAGIEEPIEVAAGDRVRIARTGGPRTFRVNYDGFISDIPQGAQILIDDGLLELLVVEKSDDFLDCEVRDYGFIRGKKSINVPGVHLNLPSLSDRDRMYIEFAIEHDLDFIAHSFVRSRKDVEDVQAILDERGSKVKIIAKIENRQGVENLPEILDAAFGVMVARGDLGIEIPAAEVPAIQKQIINACVKRAKPVITATQLLHSMIENPRPTRAEVSDVANAVFDGTDALMLSGETASGRYPVESVRMLAEIACVVEREKPKFWDLPVFQVKNRLRNYLAKTAISAALELPVKAVVVDTESGYTARIVSAYRGPIPVYATSPHMRVARELSLSYGVNPSYLPEPNSTYDLVRSSLAILLDNASITLDDLVVILAGTPGRSTGSNFIELNTARQCLVDRI